MSDGNAGLAEFVNLPSGIFLVQDEGVAGNRRLAVHVMGRVDRSTRSNVRSRLGCEPKTQVKFVFHKAAAIRRARSLSEIAKRFKRGSIVYDPTGVFSRTRELSHFAERLRSTFGSKIDKLLLDSWRRTLFVVLDETAFPAGSEKFREATSEATKAIAGFIQQWRSEGADREFAVRIGFEPPANVSVVAIDSLSVRRISARSVGKRLTYLRKFAGLTALGMLAMVAPAAAGTGDDTAAVSTPNATFIGQGGLLDSKSDKGFVAAAMEGAAPLGHDFGIQVEAGAGSDSYAGAAGHLFWRNPETALIGGFVSYNTFENNHLTRYGAEGELYLHDFTISGRAGGTSGDDLSSGFGQADVKFYATPNFSIRAGFEGVSGFTEASAGIEFKPASESFGGLSLYAEGTAGRVNTIMAGFRFHFGDDGESLIYRDRHEDPSDGIFDFLPIRDKHHHYGGVVKP